MKPSCVNQSQSLGRDHQGQLTCSMHMATMKQTVKWCRLVFVTGRTMKEMSNRTAQTKPATLSQLEARDISVKSASLHQSRNSNRPRGMWLYHLHIPSLSKDMVDNSRQRLGRWELERRIGQM